MCLAILRRDFLLFFVGDPAKHKVHTQTSIHTFDICMKEERASHRVVYFTLLISSSERGAGCGGGGLVAGLVCLTIERGEGGGGTRIFTYA